MTTATRKIVQIATLPESSNMSPKLVALCDDGTVWMHNIHTSSRGEGWSRRFDEIPQGEVTQDQPYRRPDELEAAILKEIRDAGGTATRITILGPETGTALERMIRLGWVREAGQAWVVTNKAPL